MKTIKTGVAIKKEIADKLDLIMKQLNLKSRSKAISEAIEFYVAEKSSLIGEGILSGVILLLYDHTVKGIDYKLIHAQHDYLNIIISTTHIHLDPKRCLEAIIVKGSITEIRNLIGSLERIKGVYAVRHVFFKSE